MKKILLSTLLFLSLEASQNLFEMSPNTYNKQVFSIGLSTNTTEIEDSEISRIGDNIGINIANKATLKSFNYNSGEIYWRGFGQYNIEFGGEKQKYDLELALGMSYNFNYFYTNIDFGGKYEYLKFDNENSDTYNMYNGFISGTVGLPVTKKFDIAGTFGIKYGTIYLNETISYNEYFISIPLTYKAYKNIALNLTPVYSIKEYETNQEGKDYGVNFSISWAYDN